MKDTIKSKNGGYAIRYSKDKKVALLLDGDIPVCDFLVRSYEDYIDEKNSNECYKFCERFTTKRGNQFVYWSDTELGEDYLTKVKTAI